jgi:hypothetical protein
MNPDGPTYRISCRDVHDSVRCEQTLSAPTARDLSARVIEHGWLVHGFTPAFYTPQRIEQIMSSAAAGR